MYIPNCLLNESAESKSYRSRLIRKEEVGGQVSTPTYPFSVITSFMGLSQRYKKIYNIMKIVFEKMDF